MKIYLDFDETLTESIKAICELYNIKYNTNANYKNVRKWNFLDECPNLTPKEISEMFSSESFFNILEKKPNVDEALNYLSSFGDLEIVTIGTYKNRILKENFVKNNFSQVSKYTHLEQNDEVVKMDKSMVDMSGGIFIDDVVSNLNSSNAKFKILYENIENAEWNLGWNGLKIKNWNEIYDIIPLII